MPKRRGWWKPLALFLMLTYLLLSQFPLPNPLDLTCRTIPLLPWTLCLQCSISDFWILTTMLMPFLALVVTYLPTIKKREATVHMQYLLDPSLSGPTVCDTASSEVLGSCPSPRLQHCSRKSTLMAQQLLIWLARTTNFFFYMMNIGLAKQGEAGMDKFGIFVPANWSLGRSAFFLLFLFCISYLTNIICVTYPYLI